MKTTALIVKLSNSWVYKPEQLLKKACGDWPIKATTLDENNVSHIMVCHKNEVVLIAEITDYYKVRSHTTMQRTRLSLSPVWNSELLNKPVPDEYKKIQRPTIREIDL